MMMCHKKRKRKICFIFCMIQKSFLSFTLSLYRILDLAWSTQILLGIKKYVFYMKVCLSFTFWIGFVQLEPSQPCYAGVLIASLLVLSHFLVFFLFHFLYLCWGIIGSTVDLTISTLWVWSSECTLWLPINDNMTSSMNNPKFSRASWISLQGNFCTCMAGNYKLIWDNSFSTFFKKVRFTTISLA